MQTNVFDAIARECDALKELLLEKNRCYGNSALDPLRVFSTATPEEQILVRIDDKLSRIARGREFAGDDTVQDLLGYLILLRIARRAPEATEADAIEAPEPTGDAPAPSMTPTSSASASPSISFVGNFSRARVISFPKAMSASCRQHPC